MLAGLLAALYWPFMLYSGELLATTLVVFLTLLLMAQLLRSSQHLTPRSMLAAGALLGLLAETRSNTLLLTAGDLVVALRPKPQS